MNLSHYEWRYRSLDSNWVQAVKDLQAAGLKQSPSFLRLCLARGLNTVQAIEQATNPTPQLFHDAYAFYDMEKATERLHQAIEAEEPILIYGDYDADGITSTLILYEALQQLGATVQFYLPNRLTDGYGPNRARYQDFIDQGIRLILTCDNGVAGFDAIAAAMDQGVDVIVSDHHEIQESLPEAYAIIHPRHPLGNYPFPDLSGAGVALKLATALLDEIPIEMMELAAIGTVSDCVSLCDENRTIVMSGLRLMAETHRPGLRLMLEEEGADLEHLDADTIGFLIGPRLNAIGRLGDPTPAFHLLATDQLAQARIYLAEINQKNQERKNLVSQMMQEIQADLDLESLPPVIVAAAPHWPAGVVGIVAGQLAERYHRPTLIFQYQEEVGVYKGSGRSIEAVHLFEWMCDLRPLLAQFGGHHQAVGLTVGKDQWEAFRQALLEKGQEIEATIQGQAPLLLDLSLDLAEVTTDFIEEIASLGPFGMQNPKPLFAFHDLVLTQRRLVGQEATHAKLVVSQADRQLEAIGFHLAQQVAACPLGERVSLAGSLDLNRWQNKVSPQLQVKDLGIQGQVWHDWRGQAQQGQLWQLSHAVYLCQHPRLVRSLASRLTPSSLILTYEEALGAVLAGYQNLVFLEPPVQLSQFERLIDQPQWQSFYLVLYVQDSKYLAGLPNREDFAKVYRWLQGQPPFQLRERLEAISQTLSLNIIQLKLIFQVFFEAEFVTIKDGAIRLADTTTHHPIKLEETQAYCAYQAAMASEAQLVYPALEEIKEYVRQLGEQ